MRVRHVLPALLLCSALLPAPGSALPTGNVVVNVAGNAFSYALTIHNDAPGALSQVQVTFSVVADFTSSSPAGCSILGLPVGEAGNCLFLALPAGDTVVAFAGTVTPVSGQCPVTTIVTVAGSQVFGAAGQTTDPCKGGAAAPKPDLEVTKVLETTGEILPGDDLRYTIQVRNKQGSGTATGVTIVDTLPKGAGFVGVVTFGLDCATPPAAGKLTCTVASLAANELVSFEVQLTAPSKPGKIVNAVQAMLAEKDKTPKDNKAKVETTIAVPQADLGVAIAANPATAPSGGLLPGDGVTVVATLTHEGDPVKDAVLAIEVPKAFTADGLSLPEDCTLAKGKVTCTLDLGAPSEAGAAVGPSQVSFIGVPTGPGDLVFKAAIKVPKGAKDGDKSNDKATSDPLAVGTPEVDIQASASTDLEEYFVGDFAVLSGAVRNDGPDAAIGVKATFNVPRGFEPEVPPDGCTAKPGKVECTVDLAAGEEIAFDLEGEVAKPGKVMVKVEAKVPKGHHDADKADDKASASATVTAMAEDDA